MKNLEEKQVKICSCAVIGQHPTRFKFKYNEYMTSCKRIKKRMHDVFVSLYQSGVRCFFVGGALGVDTVSYTNLQQGAPIHHKVALSLTGIKVRDQAVE